MAMHDKPFAGAEIAAAEVFDRAYLNHNTMQNQALAAEVLGLFLIQLPAMLEALDAAATAAEWAFATHTLKGAAAVIGAQRLRLLAAELEGTDFQDDHNVRLLRIQAVKAAAAEFRQAAQGEASPGPGMVVFPAPIT
jgi:HPt (histidine-containing phosphotransfer) domain-containing protein